MLKSIDQGIDQRLVVEQRIPARQRNEIDWDMASRLTKENKDFMEYMELVSDFSETGKIRLLDSKLPNDDR